MILDDGTFDRKILLLLIGLEALLFGNVYSREVAWYPPGYFDQAVYLLQAYHLQQQILTDGLGRLWQAIWTGGNPTGVALPIEGTIAGLILGGSRFPQLCVNFIAFVALQVSAFTTARALWSRIDGYASLGLVLCQTTAWFWSGGLFDFRIDFVAYCLYGVWACAVLRSRLFLDRRWAIWCAVIGAFLVLHRFLTAVYLLGVCVGFAAVCLLVGFLRRGNTTFVSRVRQRLYNLGLSVGLLVVAISPILFVNWRAIRAYYLVGHVVSDEKYVRARQVGIHDLAGHVLFYPRSILVDHLGPIFLWASAIVIATGSLVWLLHKTKKTRAMSLSWHDETFALAVIFLLGAIFGPIVVLTADIAKSPVVGGIVGGPTALLVICLGATARSRFAAFEPWPIRRFVEVCLLMVFALGLVNQFSLATRHWPTYADRRHLTQIAELDKWLVSWADAHGWKNPTISFDMISNWLNCAAITDMGFETTGKLVEFHGLLGSDISALSREEAISSLEKSDIAILTSPQRAGVYPFTQRIAEYWPDLKAWAEKNMIRVRTEDFETFEPYTAIIYVRPDVKVLDLSGDWVTSKGLIIKAKRDILERFPLVQLRGSADFSALPKTPAVTATVESEEGPKPIPAVFHRTGDKYGVDLDTSSVPLPATEEVSVRIKFDTFFVRKDAAVYHDYRELVVKAPEVRLLPGE
jgi:hypothetical protein